MDTNKEKVKNLRNKGCSNSEIANMLDITYTAVGNIAHQLIREGKIIRNPRGRPLDAMLTDLASKRIQTIISMTKARNTLEEIGNKIGLSRERVRQLINYIKQKHGEEIFKSDEPLLTLPEAAMALGTYVALVRKMCDEGGIVCRKRGKYKRVVTKSEVEKLREHPRVTGQQTLICRICGKQFIHKRRQGSLKACSIKCLEAWNRQRRSNYVNRKPTLNSLKGWRKELYQKLQNHRIPKNEQWLTLKNVGERTGLSKTQIWWLKCRHIITTKKKWEGRGGTLYAASEMEIVRRVFSSFNHSNNSNNS